MTIQFTVLGTCAAGNHVDVRATVTLDAGGTRTFRFTLNKDDIAAPASLEPEDIAYVLIRNFIKESGLTSWTTIKTQVEAHTFRF